MQYSKLISLFDIQLFAEGGAPAGGDGGAAAAAPAEGPQQGVKGNPLANVKYGRQEGDPAAGDQQQSEDRNARFEELIKGEYKDLYDARVQDTIQKRLKGNEATVQKYNALSPVLEMLSSKYGVDAGDAEALAKAIEEDETFYEDEALEKGLTVQQVKEIRKMQRENEALKQQMEASQHKAMVDQTIAGWMQEAEELKQVYPGFDLDEEIRNEDFARLLKSNVPLRTAFEVIHKDEIIPAAMQFTAKKVEEKMANAVRSGQKRPTESASGSHGAVQVKSDPSKFTKADIDEIYRRTQRGERIVL